STFTVRLSAFLMTPDPLAKCDPWWYRHRMTWRRVITLAAVLLIPVLTLTTAPGNPDLSLTSVYSATHDLRVGVPLHWGDELQVALEAPPLSSEAGAASGLLATTDSKNWHAAEQDSNAICTTGLPGIHHLTGLGDTDRCGSHAPVERSLRAGPWQGQAWEWPECASHGSFSSAAVHEPGTAATVYLEIRQPDYRPDLVDDIIDQVEIW